MTLPLASQRHSRPVRKMAAALGGLLATTMASGVFADFYLYAGAGAYDSDKPQIEEDAVSEVRLGYMFNEYIGAEANFADFGAMEIKGAAIPTDQEAWLGGLALSARSQISRHLWAYGRMGAGYWEYESVLFPNEKDDDYSAFWGFGVAWYLGENLGIGLEATRFDKIEEMDIDTAIVNLQLRF